MELKILIGMGALLIAALIAGEVGHMREEQELVALCLESGKSAYACQQDSRARSDARALQLTLSAAAGAVAASSVRR